MLVSTAVLVLLIVLVSQLMNGATTTISSSRKHLDADAQARMVFDRIGEDLANMLKRKDIDYYFKDYIAESGTMSMKAGGGDGNDSSQDGNDSMFFFSEAPAYSGTTTTSTRNSVALVGYRVTHNNQYFPNTPVLERLGKCLTWNDPPPSGMSFTPPTSGPIVGGTFMSYYWNILQSGTDGDFHVLSDSVYRLEYCYLLKPYLDRNGKTLPGTGVLSDTPYYTSKVLPGHDRINGFQDVSAIVVAIAILDPTSRKTLSAKASPMTTAISALKDAMEPHAGGGSVATTGTLDILNTWGADYLKKDSNGLISGLNPAAGSQLRVYQRYFYLNNN